MTSIAEKIQKLEAELTEVEALREKAYDQLGIIEDLFKRNLSSDDDFGIYDKIDECESFDVRVKMLKSEIGILQSKIPRNFVPIGEWQIVQRRTRRRALVFL